jgi:hypothetical protein
MVENNRRPVKALGTSGPIFTVLLIAPMISTVGTAQYIFLCHRAIVHSRQGGGGVK